MSWNSAVQLHEEFMTGGWNLHRRREQQWQAPLPAPGQALQSYTAGLSNWWLGNRLGNSPGEKQNKSYKEVLFQVLIKVQKKQFSWSFRCYCEIPLEKDGKRRHVHVKKKVPYLEFGGWHGYGSTGSRRPDASNPVVYHGEIIIFPMYRWRLWVMPKLPGAILYSRPHCIPNGWFYEPHWCSEFTMFIA